jgi:cytidine deaminase
MIDPEMATRLLSVARDATKNAYAPYSAFPVGAAALTADGTIFSGCNVENASYPMTVCAERVAVNSAIAAGHREIQAVAVVATRETGVTPCGGCRQVLNEFKPKSSDLMVILEGAEGPKIVPLAELLPRSFGPSDLA